MMKRVTIILIVSLIGLFITLCLWTRHTIENPTTVADTIRATVYDTIRYYKPTPKDSVVLRYESVRLPVGTVQGHSKSDSADVNIPISQIELEDSAYHIWASGYGVSIDSLMIYPRVEYMTITQNFTTPKPKRWHIGLSVGYGATPQGMQPFVGATLTYSLISF